MMLLLRDLQSQLPLQFQVFERVGVGIKNRTEGDFVKGDLIFDTYPNYLMQKTDTSSNSAWGEKREHEVIL